MEDVVSPDDSIDRYYQHLEEGLIAPELLLNDGSDGMPGDRQLFHYILVVHGNELEDGGGGTFEEVVEELGLSVEEPVEVMVVLMDSDRYLSEFIERQRAI